MATVKVTWTNDDFWPPEDMCANQKIISVDGVVASDPPFGKIELKNQKQTGYLKFKKTSDLLIKYVNIDVKINTIIQNGKEVNNLNVFDKFLNCLNPEKDNMEFVNNQFKIIKIFAPEQLLADLKSTDQTFGQVLMKGDEISIQLEGNSLICRTFDITKKVERKKNDNYKFGQGMTHLYGSQQNGPVNVDTGFGDQIFKAKNIVSEPKQYDDNDDVEEDEWGSD